MAFQFPKDHMEFIDRAIAERTEIIAQDPDNLAAHYNRALMNLSVGRFDEGWKEFEWRLKVPNSIFSYEWYPVDRWDGSDITGKHVLVWLEQGVGDQVMAASMIPQLADKAASVTLMADRRFKPLFERAFPGVLFYWTGGPVPERMRTDPWDYDCQLSMSDLGQMFRRSFETFDSKPYLVADQSKVKRLREKYLAGENKKLVGFSWNSANNNFGGLKTIPPEAFARLLRLQGCKYVNLQYGDHDRDLAALRGCGVELIHDRTIDPLLSLDDSAAQIAAMDLVISVSNSTVHIAGAMGIETIALVPVGHGRVWYWHTAMDQSPWYPSVKVRRADIPNQWSVVIDRVWAELFAESMATGRLNIQTIKAA